MFIQTNHKHIILDCDDVIVDMKNILIPTLNQATGKNVQNHEQKDFNLLTTFPELTYEEIFDLIIEQDCFSRVAMLEGAKEGIEKLRSMGFITHVVTSRGYHPEAHDLTAQHLIDNSVIVDSVNVVPSGATKSDVYASIADGFEFIVDDHVENLYNAEKSGLVSNGVFIDQPWNQKFKDDLHNHRFTDLNQFANVVEREYKQLLEQERKVERKRRARP